MILAGDIGGTKTVLALYHNNQGILNCAQEQTFVSKNYSHFDDILSNFLPANTTISSACLGIAGSVVNQHCRTTNLPWVLDAGELALKLNTSRVRLLNDLEAMAMGMLNIAESDFIDLNPHAKKIPGNIAVIAAGTGLGQAILHWDGDRYHPIATEGGHCDFAAQTEQQDSLLNYLRQKFNGHVSWERVLSGNGFSYLYDFLVDSNYGPANTAVPSTHEANIYKIDRNAVISRMGLSQYDPVCTEALRLFIELYGAEAGNLALKSLATGGLYIGGGIAPKIHPALENGQFLNAFTAKGRFNRLLSDIPVKLSLNPHTPLIGAASYFQNNQ